LEAEVVVGGGEFADLCCVEIDGLFDVAVEGVDGDEFVGGGGGGVDGSGLFVDDAWDDDDVALGALL
jgi:hypothetical protein